jgi:hypothetical protein
VHPLLAWSETYAPAIHQAQHAYDQRYERTERAAVVSP